MFEMTKIELILLTVIDMHYASILSDRSSIWYINGNQEIDTTNNRYPTTQGTCEEVSNSLQITAFLIY
jgi:hypothetical protein